MNPPTARASDDSEGLGGRLQLLPNSLNGQQRDLYDYLLSTKVSWAEKVDFQARVTDGRLIGPFNMFLYSPIMSRAFNAWIDSEAEQTSLADNVRQVIILAIGGVWNADYEVYAHTAVGRKAGLSDAAMRAITQGDEPPELSLSAKAALRFTLALVDERQVSDELYNATVQTLTVQGVSDMVQLIGLYMATSAFLNAFHIPSPATP